MIPGTWKKKRAAIRHYNGLANVYDELYGEEQRIKIRSLLNAVHVSESDFVLDVGCGTGFLFEQVGDSVSVLIGVDSSLGLLKVALNRSKLSRGRSLVCLIWADADCMPFPNGVFDKVFAFTLLQNLPDPSIALREMTRVAKDESTIVVTGLKKSFSRENLKSILNKGGLELTNVIEEARDIVAVCRRRRTVKDK